MSFGFKFFPLKDLFYSIFPTVGTYGGYLNGVAPKLIPNVWVALGAGLIVSVILAAIFRADNIRNYKKSLAEILATGYFINFTGRLGKLLRNKTPVEFSFPDNSVKIFNADQLSVEIGMPVNIKALTLYAEKVEQEADIVYVREKSFSEPYWLRAKLKDNKLIIYEFPRTLFSLSAYLKTEFSDEQSAERNSRKFYMYFQKKIEQLRIEHSGEIANSRLNFISV